MDHIVEIHSDVELNPSNNMQELEDRVKNAMRALQEIMKNKKQMENEKKELEQSLDNLKTDVEIIKKDELISLITFGFKICHPVYARLSIFFLYIIEGYLLLLKAKSPFPL